MTYTSRMNELHPRPTEQQATTEQNRFLATIMRVLSLAKANNSQVELKAMQATDKPTDKDPGHFVGYQGVPPMITPVHGRIDPGFTPRGGRFS
jgi:hypothetical protein